MANNLKVNFPRAGNARTSGFYNVNLTYPVIGDALFVDSVNGTSSGPGFSPESAYATVAQALAVANATSHCHIFLSPWHTESVGASGLAWNKAGVTIQGLGEGNARPTFTWHTTDAVITVSGANTTVRNIRTTVDVDEIVSMFLVSGAGCTFDTVDFTDGTSAQAIQWMLTTAAADQLTIKNCTQIQTSAAGSAQKWIQLVGTNDTVIENNKFMMTANASTGSHLINASTATVNTIINNNLCYFLGATITIVINMVTGSTGFITRNLLASGTSVATAAAITGDACYVSQNYWLDDAAASGLLTPAVGTD